MTTKKRYVPHNKKCYACGKPQGQMFLAYDPRTLKSYCTRACKNSKDIPQDIELVPVSDENLLEIITEYYSGYTEEMILSLLGKTASVRLQPAHIMHLMKIAEHEGMDKIQSTMINIIEHDMKERNMDHVNLTDVEEFESPETVYEPEPEETEEEPKEPEVKKEEDEDEWEI